MYPIICDRKKQLEESGYNCIRYTLILMLLTKRIMQINYKNIIKIKEIKN